MKSCNFCLFEAKVSKLITKHLVVLALGRHRTLDAQVTAPGLFQDPRLAKYLPPPPAFVS